MIEVTKRVEATPGDVYAVLADGWSFASWVVGAAHIRAVDPDWPAPGSRIHHSVGPWPLSIQDVTAITALEPGELVEMDARLWPVGAARVRITLRPHDDGGTEVHFAEEFVRGPARVVPAALQAALLRPRNEESIRRLADLAAGRRRTVRD